MVEIEIAPSGTTGTGVHSAANMDGFGVIWIQFEVESVGAGPAISWTPVGSVDGETFEDLAYGKLNSTVATSAAAQTGVAVSTVTITIDGLDKRRFTHIGVNVASNTNVTYSVRAKAAGQF